MRALSLAIALALTAGRAMAADPVAFVTCPIARDTGPQADVCFLVERDGARIGIANPSDWTNPQLKHRLLVEGRVDPARTICGAPALDGRASVLFEVAPECDTVLPFDGSVVGGPGGIFNSGPPEQRAAMQALARRAEADASLSVLPLDAAYTPATRPPPPRSLTIYFPFDSDRGSGPDMLTLWEMAKAAATSGETLEIVAHEGASRLESGEMLRESPRIARQRADKLAGVIAGLAKAKVAARADPSAPDDAASGWRSRFAVVRVR